ncbi:MAG: TrkA C-terminal domain-containing protein [Oscillospiraceae bacterium]
MANKLVPPQYLRIALDIAARIAKKDIPEGTKIYGRSVMASEYGVSPETIRRAMKLLADMEVVDVTPNSGVYVKSAAGAERYIERFSKNTDIASLRMQLNEQLWQHQQTGAKIAELSGAISNLSLRALETTTVQSYDVYVGPAAAVVGKNLNELYFWQATGATVVAIRRGGKVIVSPGPYIQILAEDTLVLVGDMASFGAAEKFVNGAEKEIKIT